MKSKLQLIIKGKPVLVPVELSEDQLKQITAAVNIEEVLTGWEEPQVGQIGFYEDEFNQVKSFEITNETLEFAQKLYDNENFFSTKENAEIIVRADNVIRRLRHYAISHRSSDVTMSDGGYTITYNYQDGCLELGATGNWLAIGDVVFDTEEIAQKAMNKYAAELTWYFTEGKATM